MNSTQLSQFVRGKIKEYERKALRNIDVDYLLAVYDYINTMKMIDQYLNGDIDRLRAEADERISKDRQILSVTAKDKREALAALDIVVKIIANQDSNGINEAIYITKEGCVWSG